MPSTLPEINVPGARLGGSHWLNSARDLAAPVTLAQAGGCPHLGRLKRAPDEALFLNIHIRPCRAFTRCGFITGAPLLLRVRRFAALVEGRVEAFLLGRGVSARHLVDVMRRAGRGGPAGWAADASREIAALLREVVGQRAHVQALRTFASSLAAYRFVNILTTTATAAVAQVDDFEFWAREMARKADSWESAHDGHK